MKSRLKEELEKQAAYLEGYRKQTAEMSLKVLEIVEDVNVFQDMHSSLNTVKNILDEGIYRSQDVAKMLFVTLSTITLDDNLSDDIKQKLAERRLHRNEVNLILKEDNEKD